MFRSVLTVIAFLSFCLTGGTSLAQGHESSAPLPGAPPAKWEAPIGGYFSASFTAVTDYSFAGISQTNRKPALQPGMQYRTPSLSENIDAWFYTGVWASNIEFPNTAPSLEIDVLAGIKFKGFDRRLSIDLGYTRYNYPDFAAELGYNYGDIIATVGWDFRLFQVSGRVRYSPNSFGNAGAAWNKRGQIIVPLPFLKVNENFSFLAYGTLGNQWVDRFLSYGIPSSDYWYWQTGLVVSAYGLDFTVAYTDSSISVAGCGNTPNCEGRVFLGVSKVF